MKFDARSSFESAGSLYKHYSVDPHDKIDFKNMDIQSRKEFRREERSKLDEPDVLMTMRQLLVEDGKDRLMKQVDANGSIRNSTMRSGFLDQSSNKMMRHSSMEMNFTFSPEMPSAVAIPQK